MLGYAGTDGTADMAFGVLSHPYRRRLLFRLYEEHPRNPTIRIDREIFSEAEYDEIGLSLAHQHLPKLEHDGCIEWDEDESTITVGERWSEIEPLLEVIYDHLNDLPRRTQGGRSAA